MVSARRRIAGVAVARDTNPFRISGELPPGEMIDREREVERILSLAAGGHSIRIVANCAKRAFCKPWSPRSSISSFT